MIIGIVKSRGAVELVDENVGNLEFPEWESIDRVDCADEESTTSRTDGSMGVCCMVEDDDDGRISNIGVIGAAIITKKAWQCSS